MVLRPLNQAPPVPGEDTRHVRLAVAGNLVVGLGLRHGQRHGVHIPPQHDLPGPVPGPAILHPRQRRQLLRAKLLRQRLGLAVQDHTVIDEIDASPHLEVGSVQVERIWEVGREKGSRKRRDVGMQG